MHSTYKSRSAKSNFLSEKKKEIDTQSPQVNQEALKLTQTIVNLMQVKREEKKKKSKRKKSSSVKSEYQHFNIKSNNKLLYLILK